jgi:hypothetical protein
MIRLSLGLFFFITLPFFGISIALRSWLLAGTFAAIGIVLVMGFYSAAKQRFFASLRATKLRPENRVTDPKITDALARVQKKMAREHVRFQFWYMPEVAATMRVWIESNGRIDLIFSHGLLQSVTERELEAILQKPYDLSAIRAQNRVYALGLALEQIKGTPERFRYWLLSFWLYPLERLLKIARI